MRQQRPELQMDPQKSELIGYADAVVGIAISLKGIEMREKA
jgi:hypothetical protein